MVGPTQEIYDAILKLRSQGKPVVASMGSVAASGGYYLAAAATQIVANPGTLTGSIGVILQLAEIEGSSGRWASATRSSSRDGSRTRLVRPAHDTGGARGPPGVLDDMHDQFVTAVAEVAGCKERVGRSPTGGSTRAAWRRRLGLVDALGGLDEAIRLAAELGGVPGKPRLVRPRRPWRLLDLADWWGESALSWLSPSGWPGGRPRRPCPLLGSSKLPLYLLD